MAKSLIRTESLEYEGGKITVRCSTLLSEIDKAEILDRIQDKIKRGSKFLEFYADALVQTVEFKGFGFTLPPAVSSVEDLVHGFEQYAGLPSDLLSAWMHMVWRVNQAPGTKSELQPNAPSADPKSPALVTSNDAA